MNLNFEPNRNYCANPQWFEAKSKEIYGSDLRIYGFVGLLGEPSVTAENGSPRNDDSEQLGELNATCI